MKPINTNPDEPKVTNIASEERVQRLSSQKAKALMNSIRYSNCTWKIPQTYPVFLEDNIRTIEKALWKSIEYSVDGRAFVRSCPVTPRHGVLESIAVDHITQGIQAFSKIRDVMLDSKGEGYEPEGNFIIQPFVPATSSAVVAPKMYAQIGPDHDGVTDGHGLILTFPLWMGNEENSVHDDDNAYRFLEEAGATPEECQLEFVRHRGSSNIYLTQVRAVDGNPVIGAQVKINKQKEPKGGFVGEGKDSITAKSVFVITTPEHLGELETIVGKGIDTPEGLVVSHPTGSTLGHAACHCKSNGVTYVAGKVKVGDTITKHTDYDMNKYKDHFMNGVKYAHDKWDREWGHLSTFFHQFVTMPYSEPRLVAFLAGCFAGWVIHAGTAGIIGETRHARNQQRSYSPNTAVALTSMIGEASPPDSRNEYYKRLTTTKVTYTDMIAGLEWAETIMSHDWASAYGGKNWANCCRKIRNAVKAIMSGDLDEIADAINQAEHATHNNGRLFDKFVPVRALDFGTSGFRIQGDRIDVMFRTYEIASDILNHFGNECQFQLTKVTKRPWVTDSKEEGGLGAIPWIVAVTPTEWEDAHFDSAKVMSNMSSSWKDNRGPVGDCEGCHWCSKSHFDRPKPTRDVGVMEDDVYHPPLIKKQTISQQVAVHVHMNTHSSVVEGWMHGENTISYKTPSPMNALGEGHHLMEQIAEETNSELHAQGLTSMLHLMIEKQYINANIAKIIFDKISLSQDVNGTPLWSYWNDALYSCGYTTATAPIPDEMEEWYMLDDKEQLTIPYQHVNINDIMAHQCIQMCMDYDKIVADITQDKYVVENVIIPAWMEAEYGISTDNIEKIKKIIKDKLVGTTVTQYFPQDIWGNCDLDVYNIMIDVIMQNAIEVGYLDDNLMSFMCTYFGDLINKEDSVNDLLMAYGIEPDETSDYAGEYDEDLIAEHFIKIMGGN